MIYNIYQKLHEKYKENIYYIILQLKFKNIENLKFTKKTYKVFNLFKPDYNNGISKWISREDIDNIPELYTGNNGVMRYGVFKGVTLYKWDIKKDNNKITHFKTVGYSDNILHNRPIRYDIRKFYKGKPCVLCGTKSSLVCDHKNDLYNDPRVLSTETQTKEDFQSLCNSCNLRKRAVSNWTKDNNTRFSATKIPQFKSFGIDFIYGDETFDINDPNAMKGTYYYDPVEFWKVINKLFN